MTGRACRTRGSPSDVKCPMSFRRGGCFQLLPEAVPSQWQQGPNAVMKPTSSTRGALIAEIDQHLSQTPQHCALIGNETTEPEDPVAARYSGVSLVEVRCIIFYDTEPLGRSSKASSRLRMRCPSLSVRFQGQRRLRMRTIWMTSLSRRS
jgi:hypothetical protein